MRKSVFHFAIVFLAGCLPTGEDSSPNGDYVAAAGTSIEDCEAEGGIMIAADGGHRWCEPASSREERARKLEGRAFVADCQRIGGDAWVSGEDELACFGTAVQFPEQPCASSSDCDGSCVEMTMMVSKGYCGPAKPVRGCFVEFGSKTYSKICAE